MENEKKWIHLTYVVLTLIVSWVLNKAVLLVHSYVRFPNPEILGVMKASAVASFVVTAVVAFFYFRRPKVNTFSVEVLQETKKVTWPPKKATYISTIVVTVCVLMMALILGFYDWVCGKAVGWILGI